MDKYVVIRQFDYVVIRHFAFDSEYLYETMAGFNNIFEAMEYAEEWSTIRTDEQYMVYDNKCKDEWIIYQDGKEI